MKPLQLFLTISFFILFISNAFANSVVNLSGGQRQIVNISSLVTSPTIILLDEKNNPLSNIAISPFPRTNISSSENFTVPTHALTGDPLRITGLLMAMLLPQNAGPEKNGLYDLYQRIHKE